MKVVVIKCGESLQFVPGESAAAVDRGVGTDAAVAADAPFAGFAPGAGTLRPASDRDSVITSAPDGGGAAAIGAALGATGRCGITRAGTLS